MNDEYGVYYAQGAAARVAAARRDLVWRLISVALSLLIILGCRFLFPEQFGTWGPWMIVIAGVSALLSVGFSVIRLIKISGDSKLAQPGLAIGLNRDGMLISGRWLVWPEVGSIVARPGKLGGSTMLVTTGRDRWVGRVPLDYTDIMPATLDSAVRVLSSGRTWVDLSRLD